MDANVASSSQSLHTDILFELDKIQKGSMKRRLTNELVEFAKKDAYIHAEYRNNGTKSFITITIALKDESTLYHFDVETEYPFRPPKQFRINYKDYTKYLRIESPKTLQELKLHNHINCLCCNTISCGANWGPTIRLCDFINEYKKYKQYMRNIINRILVQKIIDKYLYPHANLLEWLL